jgi:hypothetical protein
MAVAGRHPGLWGGLMAVLFLDPLALLLLLGLLVYVWLVWRGTVRRWFGRDEAWTVLAWPVPLLVIGVPPVAGGLLWLASQGGIEIGDGGVTDAAVYAAAYLAPAGAFVVWPPRWLLPGWARRRLTPLAAEGSPEVPDGAIPAVQAARGHGSRARWVWRVDGLAGHVWVDGPTLRFRSATVSDPAAGLEVDEEMVAELRFVDDGEPMLATPRGGWWSRGRLDIALDEVDRIRFRGVVPWRRDGLALFEVTGRRPAQLWVADIRRLERALTDGGRATASGPDRGEDRPA